MRISINSPARFMLDQLLEPQSTHRIIGEQDFLER
jgi:hypothetical protein